MRDDNDLITRVREHLDRIDHEEPSADLAGRVTEHVHATSTHRQDRTANTTSSAPAPTGNRRWFFGLPWYPRLLTSAAIAVPAVVVFVFVIGAISHPGTEGVGNVFGNISSGLSSGSAPSAQNYAPAPSGVLTTEPTLGGLSGTNTSGGTAAQKISSPGTLPPNEQRTVQLGYTIPHGDFETAFNQVMQLTTSLGGYVQSTTTSANSAKRVDEGTIICQLPATQLPAFFKQIPASFISSSIDFNTNSFTNQVSTTEIQLKTNKATLTDLENELAGTTDPTTIQQLQGQINSLEATIATEEASLATTSTTVATTTVTITLTEQGAIATPPTPPSAFQRAVTSGWNNDIAFLAGFLKVLLTILPELVILAILGFASRPLIRKAIRRSRGGWYGDPGTLNTPSTHEPGPPPPAEDTNQQ